MKKALALVLTALTLLALSGCQTKEAAKSPYMTDREIATYERIDPGKTQISVSSFGSGIHTQTLFSAFEKQNPDVQIIYQVMTNGTPAYRPVSDYVKNGVAPDVMFVNPDTFSDNAFVKEYLEDLSTRAVIASFEAQSLSRLAVDGFVYFLPAPSEINCILYNKTLFEQYGWSVPKTFDEFVALCLQIKADTNGAVQPWNPNAKYDNVFSTALEAFIYEELLGGVSNRGWYNDFCRGQATFAGHMEPCFELIQTLIDNEILLEEHFSYSATTRGKDFQSGLLAMYNAPISKMTSDKYEFGYMPYPTTSGEIGYVNDSFCAVLCLPKKEHTDQEKDAIERFLNFYGSSEGQQAIIGETLMVSNVKGVPVNTSDALKGIEEALSLGHRFTRMDFPGSGEINWSFRDNAQNIVSGKVGDRNWTFRNTALSMVKGEKTGADIIRQIDEKPYLSAEESGVAAESPVAEVTENMTTLDFSFYIADMYRDKAQADIGLISHGVAYRGNLVRLFKGPIYESYAYPVKPRSFENKSTLVKLSMTGAQLLAALDHPLDYGGTANCVYACSGLKCTVAPFAAIGEKYTRVTLADGAPIDQDQLYTVAAWQGTVGEEYITQTLETYEGTWEELFIEALKKDGKLAPKADGRITLTWE